MHCLNLCKKIFIMNAYKLQTGLNEEETKSAIEFLNRYGSIEDAKGYYIFRSVMGREELAHMLLVSGLQRISIIQNS